MEAGHLCWVVGAGVGAQRVEVGVSGAGWLKGKEALQFKVNTHACTHAHAHTPSAGGGGGGGGGRPEARPTLGDTAGGACFLTIAGAVFGEAVFGAVDGLATVGGASPALFSLTLRIMDGSKVGSRRGRG